MGVETWERRKLAQRKIVQTNTDKVVHATSYTSFKTRSTQSHAVLGRLFPRQLPSWTITPHPCILSMLRENNTDFIYTYHKYVGQISQVRFYTLQAFDFCSYSIHGKSAEWLKTTEIYYFIFSALYDHHVVLNRLAWNGVRKAFTIIKWSVRHSDVSDGC